MKPVCISFAGPYGCSKSPVAQYLSCEFGLPILANDVIRNEVREDTQTSETPDLDNAEYAKRVNSRLLDLIGRKQGFIHDASNDRHWERFLSTFPKDEYRFFIISFDLSFDFYKHLITIKQYGLSDEVMRLYLADHQRFIDEHEDVIGCHITDETFSKRLEIAKDGVAEFIQHG